MFVFFFTLHICFCFLNKIYFGDVGRCSFLHKRCFSTFLTLCAFYDPSCTWNVLVSSSVTEIRGKALLGFEKDKINFMKIRKKYFFKYFRTSIALFTNNANHYICIKKCLYFLNILPHLIFSFFFFFILIIFLISFLTRFRCIKLSKNH